MENHQIAAQRRLLSYLAQHPMLGEPRRGPISYNSGLAMAQTRAEKLLVAQIRNQIEGSLPGIAKPFGQQRRREAEEVRVGIPAWIMDMDGRKGYVIQLV